MGPVAIHANSAIVANTQDELAAALADRDSDWVYVRYVPSKTDVDRICNAGRQVFIAGPTVAGKELDNRAKAITSGVDGILTDAPLSLSGHSAARSGKVRCRTRVLA